MIKCVLCEAERSGTWWKCCSNHTTEQGPDVVCQDCASACHGSRKLPFGEGTLLDPRVVQRLRSGNWQFGCAGKHNGNGTQDCPTYLHHHHDEFCSIPTKQELLAAGIKPKDFKQKRRA